MTQRSDEIVIFGSHLLPLGVERRPVLARLRGRQIRESEQNARFMNAQRYNVGADGGQCGLSGLDSTPYPFEDRARARQIHPRFLSRFKNYLKQVDPKPAL